MATSKAASNCRWRCAPISTIEAQETARGATWLDRRLLDAEAVASNAGFGAEVTAAMERGPII